MKFQNAAAAIHSNVDEGAADFFNRSETVASHPTITARRRFDPLPFAELRLSVCLSMFVRVSVH